MGNQTTSKTFLTKKQTGLIIISTLLLIGLISISLFFILNMNFNDFNNAFKHSFDRNKTLSAFLFLFLFLFFIVRFFANVVPFLIRLKQLNIKVNTWESITFGLTLSFIMLISPANILYDPYIIYWLRKKGVSLPQASAIAFHMDFLYTLATLLLTWPSIIFMLTINKGGVTRELLSTPDGTTTFIFVFIGIALDIVILFTLLAFGYLKKIHVLVSRFFNWIKKKLRLEYLTKSEIKKKYIEEATMRNVFTKLMKDFKTSLWIFLIFFVLSFCLGFCMFMAIAVVNYNTDYHANFLHIFGAANMAICANKFIPLPGGEGGIEYILQHLLIASNGISTKSNQDDQYIKEVVKNAILIWRISTAFLPAIIGIGFGYFEVKNIIKQKNINKKAQN